MIRYETDSRLVTPGKIFVAIKGFNVDGHDYIEQAIKNGAVKIIAQKEIKASVPVEVVEDTQEFLREAIVNEYSLIVNEMTFIGLTGTNGKTTTCYLAYQLLKQLKQEVAYIGTIGFMYHDKHFLIENTTPDILTLYKYLMEAKNAGIKYIVMEVSSHALFYNRVAGIHYKIGGFTNLTQDHLDFHKTMEEYLKSKLMFCNIADKFIVNVDDEYSKYFIENSKEVETIGFNNGDYHVLNYEINPAETRLEFEYKDKIYNVKTNLTSKFNVYNYLTALAMLHNLGFELHHILEVTKDIYAPMGRCETFRIGESFAIVDYAHTPDSVLKVIQAYRDVTKGRILTIVGCGGDRDPKKRPIMGNIASVYSDYVIYTSDNPRTENPNKIMDDILAGVEKDNYEVILDRREAIKKGLDLLEKNDCLLILGKGHEDYQIIGREKIHLSDQEEINNYLIDKNYQ